MKNSFLPVADTHIKARRHPSLLRCKALFALALLQLVVLESLATGTATRHHQHMEGHQAHQHHTPKKKTDGGETLLKDKELLHDRHHIEEDLAGELSPAQIRDMSERELEYHYFKVHDLDKNYKLDGLELLSALAHVVSFEGDDGLDLRHLPDLEEMIDEVLQDHDRNKDGFLSFGEYRASRDA